MSMDYLKLSEKYDRVFTFGCSFTHYYWDTWADILKEDLKDTDIKFYNYGVASSSNEGIARRVQEANLIHNFNDRDAILIVWSSWHREERLYPDGWKRGGNIYKLDRKFAKNYYSTEHEFVKNSIAIISTNNFLKEKLIFQGSMVNIDWVHYNNIDQKIVNFFRPHLPKMVSFESDHKYLETYKNSFDLHSTILSHIIFLEDNFYKLKKETKKHYKKYDLKIRELFNNNHAGIKSITEKRLLEMCPKNRKIEEFYLDVRSY